MMSESEKQTIPIHILLNNSRSRDNQTMKIGQLIENTMGKIFFEKSNTKCDRETIPRLFPKK